MIEFRHAAREKENAFPPCLPYHTHCCVEKPQNLATCLSFPGIKMIEGTTAPARKLQSISACPYSNAPNHCVKKSICNHVPLLATIQLISPSLPSSAVYIQRTPLFYKGLLPPMMDSICFPFAVAVSSLLFADDETS